MSETQLAMGIDVGTSFLKVALYDSSLIPLHAETSPSSLHRTPGQRELDPNALWRALCAQIRELAQRVDLGSLAVIGITGMAESGFLLDDRNQPITPMLLWFDSRGVRQAAALRKRAGETFSRITGLRTTNVRSLAKWLWLVEHGAARTSRWSGAPEWIGLRLTGRLQTDPTLAVRTGAFDVLKGEYSLDLLEIAGAPPNLFPPVDGSSAILGSLLPAVARELGLPSTTQVVIAGHDDVVAAYGVGGARGDLIDSGGTAEGLVRIVAGPALPQETARQKMAMAPYFLPSLWALLAGAGSTGALMNQVTHLLQADHSSLDALASPPGDYPAGCLRVRLSKESLPSVQVAPGVRSSHIWSAALDLVSDRFDKTARRLDRLAGPASRILFIGGQAQSRELVRRKAGHLGLPAVIAADVDATTRGAAALALRPQPEQAPVPTA